MFSRMPKSKADALETRMDSLVTPGAVPVTAIHPWTAGAVPVTAIHPWTPGVVPVTTIHPWTAGAVPVTVIHPWTPGAVPVTAIHPWTALVDRGRSTACNFISFNFDIFDI